MFQAVDQSRRNAPASCLVHRHYDDIRSTAPSSSVLASDEHHTVLMAGGMRTFRVPWHSHDCLMILLPLRGAINLRDEAYQRGTWLSEERFAVVPKTRMHAGEADNTPHIVLYLTDSLVARIASQFGSLHRLQSRVRETLTFAVTPEIRMLQYLCCAGDAFDPAMRISRVHVASALLLHVLAQVERTEPLPCASDRAHGEGIVREIRSFLDVRLADEVSLNLIADKFGLSRRHTTRLFRRWSGLSIIEYLEQQRIEAARTMLTDTTLPVGEIAWRVGFEFRLVASAGDASSNRQITKRNSWRSPPKLTRYWLRLVQKNHTKRMLRAVLLREDA